MDTFRHVVMQQENEARYNRKHIDGYIREAIQDSAEMQAKIVHGVQLVTDLINGAYYASKMIRMAQLHILDLTELVTDMLVGVAYCQQPELFTSVTAQMAGRLKFSDKVDAIKTVAELMAIVCITDAFDITKADRNASLMVVSRIPLDDSVIHFINNSHYLPPMVCAPLELENNYSSGYLTHTDSLILGNGNHHDGDICLDVLNTINSVELQLDTQFLSTVEEDPNSEFTLEKIKESAAKKGKPITEGQAVQRLIQQKEHWAKFKQQSYSFYALMAEQGNRFYLTHKVDKRGRIYSQGYHLSTQGTAFKKAMIELAHEELIEGVPL